MGEANVRCNRLGLCGSKIVVALCRPQLLRMKISTRHPVFQRFFEAGISWLATGVSWVRDRVGFPSESWSQSGVEPLALLCGS